MVQGWGSDVVEVRTLLGEVGADGLLGAVEVHIIAAAAALNQLAVAVEDGDTSTGKNHLDVAIRLGPQVGRGALIARGLLEGSGPPGIGGNLDHA